MAPQTITLDHADHAYVVTDQGRVFYDLDTMLAVAKDNIMAMHRDAVAEGRDSDMFMANIAGMATLVDVWDQAAQALKFAAVLGIDPDSLPLDNG